jgi:predicted dehydrogenase
MAACTGKTGEQAQEGDTPKNKEGKAITFMTLDPGHFHAALVQKVMYDAVSEKVYVFAPEGEDLQNHLDIVNRYNKRDENPTSWDIEVYAGEDFYEKMMEMKPGNVVVLAGNNSKKTEYILNAVKNGLHVYADKPMAITPDDFELLEQAFDIAREKDLLIYDIMTERFEVTTIMQKLLSQREGVFGQLQTGSPEEPAITKESVHHFFKYVSGKPLKRPAWFFDVNQEGEAIADVGTHLVDLVMWECYPGEIMQKSDVEILDANHWPTKMTAEEFEQVTGKTTFPEYLKDVIKDGVLHVYSNSDVVFKIKDVYAKVVVEWKYKAPEGAGDTHYSIMRGQKSNLIIRQGEEQGYVPTLYVEANEGYEEEVGKNLATAIEEIAAEKYAGLSYEQVGEGQFKVNIPQEHRIGHEAHFGQVTGNFVDYFLNGNMPAWEVPNMIVKYYITTGAVKKILEK